MSYKDRYILLSCIVIIF